MHAALLEVSDVSAGYGGRPAIAAASFSLRRGQLLGLIGPNGAGKSTLLRAIAGLVPISSGRVRIDGDQVQAAREQALAKIGYAVDPAELPHCLTGRQYLEMIASIRMCGPRDWPDPDLDRTLGFQPWFDTVLAHCSLGTKAKFAVAGAFLGRPPLLILDESLNGLDPVSRWRLRQVLRDMVGSKRHALIVTTHQIEALAALATDLVYIDEGRIAHRWTAAELEDAGPGGIEAMVMAAMIDTPGPSREPTTSG